MRFTFTGPVTTGYYYLRDSATGQMLVAEPGKTYDIQAVDPSVPVPPDDRWVAATGKAAKAATT